MSTLFRGADRARGAVSNPTYMPPPTAPPQKRITTTTATATNSRITLVFSTCSGVWVCVCVCVCVEHKVSRFLVCCNRISIAWDWMTSVLLLNSYMTYLDFLSLSRSLSRYLYSSLSLFMYLYLCEFSVFLVLL